MATTVYTLYEGHYSLGVGALLNSLLNKGFVGTYAVAYRGKLPDWAGKLKQEGPEEYSVAGVRVKFIPLNPPMHLRFYKSFLGLELYEKYCPDTGSLFYFDPDIVIKADWSFYESWAEKGIALCLDNAFGILPSDHPWRAEWAQIGSRTGLKVKREQNFYYNGGFFGLTRDKLDFLRLWRDLTLLVPRHGGRRGGQQEHRPQAGRGGRPGPDERRHHVYPTAPELRGSRRHGLWRVRGYLMSHAVYGVKPWVKNFTLDLFKTGNAPSLADKEFMKNISSPIQLFSPVEERLKRANIKVASALGRVMGR
jgi:hypothetical protein